MGAVFEEQQRALDNERRIQDLKDALREIYSEEGLSEEIIEAEERACKRTAHISEQKFREIKDQVKKELNQ